MTRTKKYNHEEIAAMYLSGEKTTVIAAYFGCHETTPGKIAKSIGLKIRKQGNNRGITQFVADHIAAPSKRIAEALGTTAGYVNKLKYQARKKAAQSN